MSHESRVIVRMLRLGLAAVMGAALITALDQMTAPARSLGPAPEATATAVLHAVSTDQARDVVEPAAICRIAPECWTNADCDVKCGAGLGKCVHSNCPVRICRCR